LGLESWLWTILGVHPSDFGFQNLFSAWLKPLVFFYASARAREAVEALSRIARMVTRILLIEVFLILTFAAVACRLFHEYDSFKTLSRSWLSLFECT
jgi:membrane protein DedA with SNARE-associated domain